MTILKIFEISMPIINIALELDTDGRTDISQLILLDRAHLGILKPRVNAEAHPNVQSLTRALSREWEKLTQEEINRAIERWMARVDAMIAAKGKRFE